MAKETVEPMVKDQVCLRLLEESDLPMTLAWRNQGHIRRWFVYSAEITPAQHADWFRKYIDREDDFVFIIEAGNPVRKPVGQVSIYQIDRAKKTAEFGRLMVGDPDAKGKGIARLATRMALEFGFSHLGLEVIYLEVFKDNGAAIHIYQSVGFAATHEEDQLIAMQVTREEFKNQVR
jgi:diamine N-acetyltransferase